MATASQVPTFVRLGNLLTKTMLRAAGEATLTRGRRTEAIQATELPSGEASLVLKRGLVDGSIPSFLVRYFEITTNSSREELEEAAARHPVFQLQRPA